MKKVASSNSSAVFDDPLFNPGESFKTRDSDEYIAPASSKKAVPELVNTLTVSEEDDFLSAPKPMQRNISKPAPTPVPVGKEKETPVPQKIEAKKTTQKSDPLKAKSVFDNEGEDLFLVGSSGQKKKTEPNFEEELFGKSLSSNPSELRQVKLGEKNLRLGTHDSDSDNEIQDLGVGAIMEREELDFDMFGKSSVRQYEPMQTGEGDSGPHKESNTSATSSVRKDDLILESNDILSDFESLLSDKGTSKKSATVISPSSSTAASSSSSTASANVVVNSSYDIDAYISQQEEDSGGGLFD